MNIQAWLSAFRLRTLPLALSSIFMAGFLAGAEGEFRVDIFSWCVITTIALQILSNLANDYGDTVNGADSAARKGPQRAVQSGAISISSMRIAILVFVLISLVSGIYLLWISFGFDLRSIGFFLLLGVLSIVAAIAYTVGRKPYGYLGLGDLSVLLFFGLVGVLGSYYLFTKQIHWSDILPALSCGFFSVGVLNINNIRDIESDKLAGKYSVPVRIGHAKAVRYHLVILIAGWISIVGYTLMHYKSPWQWLFVLCLPLFIRNGRAVSKYEAQALDPYLKQMAIATLIFVILFGVGLNMA
jgi:1,4-dihydroxy-2-naphthoate octaprenyltransferase